jgi:alkanesulfonate monooxygenase SsuD/methylene tetrahydromethanopterin reductase-like flavin-dependent oxidoreductase (luciferase family)
MSEVALCEVGDKHNWKYAWFTEHHFLKEYSHISASETLMAWVLARTQNIHVASGIINITPPVNHPARVAERVAMIDQLSGGRFEFGVGRGSSSTEQRGFGIADPAETVRMIDEVLPQFKRMWAENEYRFDGEFFSMPPRNVLPKPLQDPHPPMWIAAGNPGTFEKAARMGLGVLCFTTGSPEMLAPLVEKYKTEIVNAEPVGEYVNDNVMVTSQLLCLEDGQKVRDIASAMTSGYQNSLVFHYLDTFPTPPGVPEWPALIPEATPADIDERIAAGLVCMGTPDEVAKSVQAYADIGADQLVFGMLSTTMPVEIAIEAVETFGTHVIPQFDHDLVHRTTRLREAYVAERGPRGKTSLFHALDDLPAT